MMYEMRPGASICEYCKWSKDKVKNQFVNACFCTEYGIIIAKRKERCRGFEQVRKPKDDD